jgi:hypothetical protein
VTPGSGPVSELLERRILAHLNEKKLVVWLDAEGAFTPYADCLAERCAGKDFPAPVLTYRGSFLELMLALEDAGSTLDKPPLLLHVPGFNVDSIRATPLLELYECAYTLQLRLDTLVQDAANGRVALPEIASFLAEPDLTLERADAWLARAAHGGQDALADYVGGLDATALVNYAAGQLGEIPAAIQPALRERASALFGTSPDWWSFLPDSTEAVIGWLLCVEFVHDLRRPPRHPALIPLKDLPAKTVDRCQHQAARLRREQPERYRTCALGIEERILDQEHTTARDLGRIDTFRFEALAIFDGAVREIVQGGYRQCLEWSEAHEEGQDFWIQTDQPRAWAWRLVGEAARLGIRLEEAHSALADAHSLDEALRVYTERCAPVDRAHRSFEQRFAALYSPLLPDLTQLTEAFDRLRAGYWTWADALARDFARICREAGALPPVDLQQRFLFDDVVLPLVGHGQKVAVFMLDALRYEMAQELCEELRSAGVTTELRARYAELPTITSVGMNAVAPIARDGKLVPLFEKNRFAGFRAGEAAVRSPADRRKAIAARTGGREPLAFDLADLQRTSVATLKKQVAQTHLVAVHSVDLDESGEAGFGVRIFDAILRDVLAARHQLEQAGIQHFVFTSDHGFLLQERGARAPTFGSRGDADRRYLYSETDRAEPDHLAVPLSSLGYDAPGVLLFREDTREFGTGRAPGGFSHGGNSLQERVIPVLHIFRKRVSHEVRLAFELHCEALPSQSRIHRLRLRASIARTPGQAPLDFASAQPVDVAMQVPQHPDVLPVIKDVRGPGASLHAGNIRLDASIGEWTEVHFLLQGPVESARVPVTFFIAGSPQRRVSPEAYYPVSYERPAVLPSALEGPPPPPVTELPPNFGGWGARLADPDAGKAFDHLERFNSLNEEELVKLLGNPRRARAFALRFDELRQKVTFDTEVFSGPDGKRYQKVLAG